MPNEMPIDEALAIRNLDEPAQLSRTNSAFFVYNAVHTLLDKLAIFCNPIPSQDTTYRHAILFKPTLDAANDTVSIQIYNLHFPHITTLIPMHTFSALLMFLRHLEDFADDDDSHIDWLFDDALYSCQRFTFVPDTTPRLVAPSLFLHNLIDTAEHHFSIAPLHQSHKTRRTLANLRALILCNPETLYTRHSYNHPNKLTPNPLTDPQDTLSWLLRHKLADMRLHDTAVHHITRLFDMTFNSTVPRRQPYNPLPAVLRLRDKNPDMIFVQVDHNARTAACLCPVRYHEDLKSTFYDDAAHFAPLHNDSTIQGHPITKVSSTQLVIFLRKQADDAGLPLRRSWRRTPAKQTKIPSLYTLLKLDGIRSRPVGAYVDTLFKNLYSYSSRGLYLALSLSHLRQATIFGHTTVIDTIAHLNDTFQDFCWFTIALDIKRFFTEIKLKHLKFRVNYILRAFAHHNKTNIISVPKLQYSSELRPHAGADTSGRFVNLTIAQIEATLSFASMFAVFQLGNCFLHQFEGLPIG